MGMNLDPAVFRKMPRRSVLDEMGMKELAEVLRAEVKKYSDNYEVKLRYLNLALFVFEKLAGRGFERRELWA